MSSWRLKADDTALFVIDVQERMMPAVADSEALLRKIAMCIQGAAHLGLAIYFSEQYPKGLGGTLPSIRALSPDAPVFEKTAFSSGAFAENIPQQNILLIGAETHICVRQTALDLRMKGKNPILVADAVGSRDPYHKQTALSELQTDKFLITTVEAALFEILEDAKHPKFKDISKLVK